MDTNPYGDLNDEQMGTVESLIARLSPVAKTVMDAEQRIISQLMGVLDSANTLVESLDSLVKVNLSGQMTQPILAVNRVDTAVRDNLTLALQRTAELASAGMEQPVLIPQGMFNTSTRTAGPIGQVPGFQGYTPHTTLPMGSCYLQHADGSIDQRSPYPGEDLTLCYVGIVGGNRFSVCSDEGLHLAEECGFGDYQCPGQTLSTTTPGVNPINPGTPPIPGVNPITPGTPPIRPVPGNGTGTGTGVDGRVDGNGGANGASNGTPAPGGSTGGSTSAQTPPPGGSGGSTGTGGGSTGTGGGRGTSGSVLGPSPINPPAPPTQPPGGSGSILGPQPGDSGNGGDGSSTPTPTPTRPPGSTTSWGNTGTSCGLSPDDPCWIGIIGGAINQAIPGLGVYNTYGISPGEGFDLQPLRFDITAATLSNVTFQDDANNVDNCECLYKLNILAGADSVDRLVGNAFRIEQPISSAVNAGGGAKWGAIFSLQLVPMMVLSSIGQVFVKLSDWVFGKYVNGLGKLADVVRNEIAFNYLNFFCLGGLSRMGRILAAQNNCIYPVKVPSAEAAAAAWLGKEIDDCTFQTYVMADDYKFEPYKRVAQAGRFKFSALELVNLSKRKGLKRGELKDRFREIGSLKQEDMDEALALFEQLPGPSDIIRMMVRDVVNPQVLDKFGMDDGFTDNWQGKLAEYGDMQGVSKELAQFFWRAHWTIPSPTQLYEMLHRLRHNSKYGGPDKVLEDVRVALKQQDILPYWIERLIEISYHPLTRTDLNRAYDHGWLEDDDYVAGMYANGYSDDDAATLLRFAKEERKIAIRNNPIMAEYRRGYMSEQDLADSFEEMGYDSSLRQEVVDVGNLFKRLEHQEQVMKALESEYKKCRIKREDVFSAAQSFQIDDQVVKDKLDVLDQLNLCAYKHESVSVLCQSLDAGLIDDSEYTTRAKLLKIDDDSIGRYLNLCHRKLDAKRQAQRDKIQKDMEKQAEKDQKDAEKAAKEEERLREKAAKQAASLERARQARNALLEESSARVAKALGESGEAASALVVGLYERIQSVWHLTQTESAHALLFASRQFKGTTADEFTSLAMGVAESAVGDYYSLFQTVLTGTNGSGPH